MTVSSSKPTLIKHLVSSLIKQKDFKYICHALLIKHLGVLYVAPCITDTRDQICGPHVFFLNILNRPKGKKVENHFFEACYTRPGSGTRQVQLCQFVRLLTQLVVFLFLVDPEINPVAQTSNAFYSFTINMPIQVTLL